MISDFLRMGLVVLFLCASNTGAVRKQALQKDTSLPNLNFEDLSEKFGGLEAKQLLDNPNIIGNYGIGYIDNKGFYSYGSFNFDGWNFTLEKIMKKEECEEFFLDDNLCAFNYDRNLYYEYPTYVLVYDNKTTLTDQSGVFSTFNCEASSFTISNEETNSDNVNSTSGIGFDIKLLTLAVEYENNVSIGTTSSLSVQASFNNYDENDKFKEIYKKYTVDQKIYVINEYTADADNRDYSWRYKQYYYTRNITGIELGLEY